MGKIRVFKDTFLNMMRVQKMYVFLFLFRDESDNKGTKSFIFRNNIVTFCGC